MKLTDFDLSYAQGGTTAALVAAPPPAVGDGTGGDGGAPLGPAPAARRDGPALAAAIDAESAAAAGAAAAARAAAAAAVAAPAGAPPPPARPPPRPAPAAPRLLLAAVPEGRANSFVGTEEYLAPEIVTGAGHDSMVDWWSFGVLLYELLTGTTPFRGARRDATFENVVKRPLAFPATPALSPACRDLIARLLAKDPRARLGAAAGGDEVKQHPWFASVDWALLRQAAPPYVPGGRAAAAAAAAGGGSGADAPLAPADGGVASPPAQSPSAGAAGAGGPFEKTPPTSGDGRGAGVGAASSAPASPPPGAAQRVDDV